MFKAVIKWKDGTSSVIDFDIAQAPDNPTEEDFKDLITMTKAVVYSCIDNGQAPGRSKEDLDTIEIIETSSN